MNLRSICQVATCLVLTVVLAGCGKQSSQAKYIPSSSNAREALRAALESWKKGDGNNDIETPKTVVRMVDARWRDRKRLESYEILEEVKNPEHPEFKVKMQVKGLPEETISYVVFGLDPLLVYRDEDYKQFQNW